MNASSLIPRYTEMESRALINHIDRRGLLELATDKRSLPYFARARLQEDLLERLGEQGLPSPVKFFDIIKDQKAVISGSFVPYFVDEPNLDASESVHYSPRDIDVYVGRGRMEATLGRLKELDGAQMRVLQTFTMPEPRYDGNGRIIHVACPDALYHNSAIHSMARVRFDLPGGNLVFLDVMESLSESAVMPIARFNLTHLRRGITADGYFDLHPQWNHDWKTYTSPRMATETTRRASAVFFVRKYQERGLDVDESGVVDCAKTHECGCAFDCPLTLRNTADDGVQFVPFTEEAAVACSTGAPSFLSEPVVHWKHGGRCSQSPVCATPALFDSNGVEGEEDVYAL